MHCLENRFLGLITLRKMYMLNYVWIVKYDLLLQDTLLMNLVLIETMDKMIEAETKANCEACQINSDSQFDHCRSGNCLDEEINQFDLYFNPAHQKIKINMLIHVFDQVRKEMGLKPILSAQLAKCALAIHPKITDCQSNPGCHTSQFHINGSCSKCLHKCNQSIKKECRNL